MFSTRHSNFSKLKFLQPSLFDKEVDDLKEFLEYHFSASHLATDKFLFDTLLKADDDILPLSVLHDIIDEFDFSLDDLVDLLGLTRLENINKLSKTHFRLYFRLYKLYYAIVISVDNVLGYHGSREDPCPWVELKTLALDHRIITTDIELMTKALASNVPSNIECKVVEGLVLARKAPNMDYYDNKIEVFRIEIPYEHKMDMKNRMTPPVRLFRSAIVNAYKPSAFLPTQLLTHEDTAIVSVRQLFELFPAIRKFTVSRSDYFLTVDNHLPSNTSEFLVELYHITLRVSFVDQILDARFSIYDSDRYNLILSDEGYSLSCKQPVHSIGVGCIPTSAFLGDRFTVL